MATAIIGVGNIGKALAGHLVDGGERVVLASNDPPDAIVKQLGDLASAATVGGAIEGADTVIFAVWLDTMKTLIEQNKSRLADKVVVDPSNPVAANDKGGYARTLPDGVSSGSVVAELLPASAHFAKAFGTLAAESLQTGANRTPHAVLFYATDDDRAGAAVERLIRIAGFDPVKAGGIKAALRIEMYGDLHQYGGLKGQLVDADQARAAVFAHKQ
jgi:8-hydroxy-5-deazaflavin:NADPH oxidoreductase